MKSNMLSYLDRDSVVHRLSGAGKLICFLLWSVSAMVTYDTRLIALMFLLSICIFGLSKIKFREIKRVVLFISFFLTVNAVAIFIFSPYEGVKIYGTRHELFNIGSVCFTAEQLFYELNVVLKYFTVLPVALLFLLTTNPSEFAASLNGIGVSYRVALAVSLALRYIPDIQNKFNTIKIAQQARGLSISKEEKFTNRVRNLISIVIPLIFSSFDRIEIVSNAMELRRLGKKPKRTWYSYKGLKQADYIAVSLAVLFLIASVILNFVNNGRFYNPFI